MFDLGSSASGRPGRPTTGRLKRFEEILKDLVTRSTLTKVPREVIGVEEGQDLGQLSRWLRFSWANPQLGHKFART